MKDVLDQDGFIILEPEYSDLYLKRNYLAPIRYCINRITEYDIKHANVSVMRRYSSLISKSALDKLDSLGEQRSIEFGKLIRDSEKGKEISKRLAAGIIDAKHLLFRENRLQDRDILSIKNDAVFVIGRRLKHTTFGYVTFAEKNTYTAYIGLDSLEFYYAKNGDITAKGISDEILEEPDHKNGMLIFLKTVFQFLVTENKPGLRKYLKTFSREYKALELPYQYYRELNQSNCYRSKYTVSGYGFNYTQANNVYKPELVTTFNYRFYVLPIIQQFYW